MLVPYTKPNGEESQYHMSDWLCHQLDKIKSLIMKRDRDYVMIIDGPEGSGKCQPADSKVLMANGEFKNIQDIKVGDKILSPQKDGTTKFANVLNITNWFCDEVYDIISMNRQKKKLYSCSHNHLIPINCDGVLKHVIPKDIINKSKVDFRRNNRAVECPPIKEFYGRDNCVIEPYTLGALLGDGCLRRDNFDITIADEEIIKEIEKTYVIMSVSKKQNCKASSYRFSKHNYFTKIKALALFDELSDYNLIGTTSESKFVPDDAKYSDLNYRKRLLAGLIDTDGYRCSKTGYEITIKSEQLSKDIGFIVQSLGGSARISKVIKNIKKTGFKGEYFRISFNFPYDIELPIQVYRKKRKSSSDLEKKHKVGIHVLRSEKSKPCQVYGFEIDGDSHWYITDNFQVTHNSTLASQCARYVDPTFDESRMALNPDEFVEQVNKCSKQAVVYDEAFVGLGSASVLSPVNKLLVEMMMEMRKKNLFVILVIPSLFYLNKYSALHRSQVLLHTYFSRGKPGAFASYNTKKLQTLYLYGKRKMSYSFPRVSIRQRFIKTSPIDWVSYEQRKIESLKRKERNKNEALQKKQLLQRDAFLKMLREDFGLSQTKIIKRLEEFGLDIGASTISDALKRANAMKKIEKEVKPDVQMPTTV